MRESDYKNVIFMVETIIFTLLVETIILVIELVFQRFYLWLTQLCVAHDNFLT